MKKSIKAGLIFGVLMGLWTWLMSGFKTGLFTFFFSAVVFGVLMGIFIKNASKNFKQKATEMISNGVELKTDGPANYFVDRQSVGGAGCI